MPPTDRAPDLDTRTLDIEIAQRAGFYVKHGTLYMPTGTLLGGDVHANMGQYELESNDRIWQDYTPRFTKHVDDCIWLIDQLQPVYFELSYSPDRMNWRAEFTPISRMDEMKFADAREPAEAICRAWLAYADTAAARGRSE